ncbi:MAG: hypothetical protein HFE29_01005 [Clostridia bacterium]|jgi:TfoX/Sxy family transcriptional regulator of competence genes|nr:hypothetical protein [Clostridia bacterium]
MPTTVDYIKFVCDRINKQYNVRYKKMFGEYMVYANEKPIFLVCDNCVYVKKLAELSALLSEAEVGIPYDGAKEHYILDIENPELMDKVTEILERIAPLPKSRKK